MSEENPLARLRAQARLSQSAFAKAMGVALRTYEDLENGRSQVREVHLQAARMVIVQLAAVFPDAEYIPVPLTTYIEQTLVEHVKAQENGAANDNPTR